MPPRKEKKERRPARERPPAPLDLAARLEARLTPRVQRIAIGLLIGAMALLRLFYFLEFGGHAILSGDSKFFIALARQIAGGDVFLRGQSLIFSPLYYYFLGAIFALFGEALRWVFFFQFLFGILAGWLLIRLARDLGGALTALFTGGLYLFYGMILLYEGQLLDASFSVLLPTGFLLLLHRAGATGRPRNWLGAGALLGLFALTRPNSLLFLPLAGAWALWVGGEARVWRARLVAPGCLIGGALLCILPFTLRNWVVTGEPVLITAHGGVNFYVGNNERATGFFTPPPGMPPLPGVFNLEIPRQVAERESGRSGMSDSQVSSYWFSKGTAFIRGNPGAFLRLTLKKARAYFNGYEVPLNFDFRFLRQLSWSLKLAFLPLGAILPLGLVGLALAGRRWRDHLLLYLYLLSYSASVILFFITARYRLPVVPVLLLYGGLTLRELLASSRRPARLGLLLGSLALLTLLVNTDLGIRFNEAIIAHYRGYTLESIGRPEEAIACYEQALAIDPDQGLTHLQLARLFAARGEGGRAWAHYQAAQRLAPLDRLLQEEMRRFSEHAGGGPPAGGGAYGPLAAPPAIPGFAPPSAGSSAVPGDAGTTH